MTFSRSFVDPAPLLHQLRLSLPAPPGQFGETRRQRFETWVPHPVPTGQQMADAAGVSLRTMKRWKAGGGIDLRFADTIAIRCGFHPAELWPDWPDLFADDEDAA